MAFSIMRLLRTFTRNGKSVHVWAGGEIKIGSRVLGSILVSGLIPPCPHHYWQIQELQLSFNHRIIISSYEHIVTWWWWWGWCRMSRWPFSPVGLASHCKAMGPCTGFVMSAASKIIIIIRWGWWRSQSHWWWFEEENDDDTDANDEAAPDNRDDNSDNDALLFKGLHWNLNRA